MRRNGSLVVLGLLVAFLFDRADAQTLSITNDQGVAITGVQRVNVGEHVRLRAKLDPITTTSSNITWVVTGAHLKDWVAKDAEPVAMSLPDYHATEIHLIWRDATTASIAAMLVLYQGSAAFELGT